jgi:hypothetical protein
MSRDERPWPIEKTFALYRSVGITTIRWSARCIDGVSCDPCILTDGVVVTMGEMFPNVNVIAPPAHNGCGCALIFGGESEIGTNEDRDRAKRGGYSAEEWEQRSGHRHRIDVLRDQGLR